MERFESGASAEPPVELRGEACRALAGPVYALCATLEAVRRQRMEFEGLLPMLNSSRAAERKRAVLELRRYRDWGLVPLQLALQDREGAVRLAAAEGLAIIGDGGSIPALASALRRCFAGGSARRQLLLGPLIFVAAAA